MLQGQDQAGHALDHRQTGGSCASGLVLVNDFLVGDAVDRAGGLKNLLGGRFVTLPTALRCSDRGTRRRERKLALWARAAKA